MATTKKKKRTATTKKATPKATKKAAPKKKIVRRKPRVKKSIRSLKATRFKKVDEPWGIAPVWNKSLEQVERREPYERDYLWATDMAKAPVDVFLSMKATPQSNPPNARALRKFEAGDVFEWIVKLILLRAGILRIAQEKVEYQYKGMLRMSGRIDYIAGGIPDVKKVEEDLEGMDLPDVFKRGAIRIVKHIKRTYPDGLPEMPLEIKSIASYGADAMERTGRSIKAHRAQVKFYLNGSRYDKGMLIYICRDDLRMFEYCIERGDKETEKEVRDFCKEMTDWWRRDEQPTIEDPIIFDWDAGKFSKNLKIEYSAYLNKLYGFKEARRYSEYASPIAARFNRVVGRIKHGKTMTDNNMEALSEMEEMGFNTKKIIKAYANGDDE